MRFTRLRLSGFKSFVDATDLVIEPGLTGIVGPNGCGKSNLVEALRWVMGETSARRMRGDDMDDVIFGGTAQRPQRNLAEVVLAVDNSGRTAPAGLNDSDELEVLRRIERGSGSDYRVNGKLVRARDVQLLFADNASGAGSPALVSQGKVAQIIGAKPQERRGLLEEAAGVTGLHSRRHEAELRLRAAETNLTRLEDVIGAMDTQLGALRKQARQAVRYRDLSDRIRKTEAILWHRRWSDAETAEDRARDAFHAAEDDVRERMVLVSRLTTERTEAAAVLPDKRRAEADAAAALQRLVIAREQLDADEKRIGEEAAALRRRLQQLAGDLGREEALAADAGAALERLEAERVRLAAESADETDIEDAAADAVAETLEAVDELERRLNRLTEEVAALDAQRTAGGRRVEELERRIATLSQRRNEQAGQRDTLAARLAGQSDLPDAELAAEAADERLEDARATAESAETAREAAEQTQTKAREAMQAADAVRARLKAEANALRDLLAADSGDLFPPLIDAVTVAPGLESALAAALRDDLTAPLDEAAPIHWRTLPPLDAAPLPEGAEPLTKGVKGPEAVARALAHVGVVAGEEQGKALAGLLRPGQILVSRDGGAWRWDGLTVRPGAPTAAAVRLRQRNRLADLRAELDIAEDAFEDAREGFDAARRVVEEATAADRRAREVVREAFAAAGAARELHARLVREAAAAQSALASLTEAVDRLSADLNEAETQKAEAETALVALADSREGRERVNEARADLAERRTLLAERRSTLDRLRREADGRRKRLTAIGEETASWTQRSGGAGQRVGELNQRRTDAEAALAVLDGRPAEIAQSRQDVLSRIAEAERKRRLAADALAVEENRLGEAERALKAAESALSDAREARARAEAAVGAALEAKRTLAERILERLDCRPEDTRAVAGLPPDEPLPEAADTETRLDRLLRERDAMGPVNLRAEIEAEELETQIASLNGEREDLIKAIGRLRQAIGNLNREARERLIAAFDIVNRDFQELFIRLFGGGKAYLELVNAEDPLESGLEIYASPPGKRLQNLSLLSGGEQALTALSLLFAVFRSNPAPICVLDEVDAPLDEANVGRFCDLVEDMAHEDRTRFLIVTHHRLTMARVHRLFGVTMAERGVSQLVSVNLDEAEEMVEPVEG